MKNPPANAGDARNTDSTPESGKSPGEGNDNPTPVLLPGKSHGQRSLVGYSPWGRQEWERTSPLNNNKAGHRTVMGNRQGRNQLLEKGRGREVPRKGIFELHFLKE